MRSAVIPFLCRGSQGIRFVQVYWLHDEVEAVFGTHSLSMNPGINELPPTTSTFARKAGCSPVGSTDKLCSTTSGIPGCVILMSPGLNSISGTVKRSFPRINTSSDIAEGPAPESGPFFFLEGGRG